MERLTVNEFLSSTSLPLIDVRSPGEFNKGHICGARNIALFEDEERSVIGTLYKQRGKKEAISQGLDIAGPKMSRFSKMAGQLAVESRSESLGVYCWRGGMRSEKMAWLFELTGLQCKVLDGGYKNFRKQLQEDFRQRNEFIVIQGATGSGKTDLLKELENAGEQIIDLEELAGHRGSAFGAIGKGPQPSTQQFQNALYEAWRQLDRTRRIWVEGESRTIGRVYLPDTFWQSMNEARLMEIEVPRENRVQRLLRDYGNAPTADLELALHNIERRLGGQHLKRALQLLADRKLSEVAELLLDYYDRTYLFSREKHKLRSPVALPIHRAIDHRAAGAVMLKADELGW